MTLTSSFECIQVRIRMDSGNEFHIQLIKMKDLFASRSCTQNVQL